MNPPQVVVVMIHQCSGVAPEFRSEESPRFSKSLGMREESKKPGVGCNGRDPWSSTLTTGHRIAFIGRPIPGASWDGGDYPNRLEPDFSDVPSPPPGSQGSLPSRSELKGRCLGSALPTYKIE